MKFAALTLALLLAVGSQAAELDHVRGAARGFLVQARDSVKNIMDAIEDPQHAEARAQAKDNLDIAVKWLLEKQTEAAPYTDAFLAQAFEATAGARASFEKEVEALRSDLELKFSNLRSVVEKHISQYEEKLRPVMEDYKQKISQNMATLSENLAPIRAELSPIVRANLQETVAAALPLLDSVRTSFKSNLETAHEAIGPYIQEYRDQFDAAASQVNFSEEKKAQLKQKLAEIVALFQSN